MADKFVKKFGTEAHPLKIGKSFEKKNDTAYHSIRYDFKPGSIDEERKGSLEVEENNSVSVRLPHTDGQGATNYKGSAKPANTKDCVLIIDWETGELRLERVSNQILLKKTRAERNPSVYSDIMNNDVSIKDCVVPSSSENCKKELENHQVKKEHDNHPKIKEHQLKKEPDKHQNVQQPMRKSDVLKKVLSPPPVKQETATISVPMNDSLGLGLGLSDSSDDSDSDSDSSSGSQSDSSAPSSAFSRKGQLPTARPQKLHKIHTKKESTELKAKISPQGANSMPSLGNVSSMPSLGDVSTMLKPSLGDVSSMPSLGGVSSMPSLGDVSSMPSLGDVSSMPSLGDVSSMPSFGFGESSSSEQRTRVSPLPPATSSSSVASKAAASVDSSMPSIANRSADLGDDLELSDSDSE